MVISKNEYKYETNRKVNEHIECIRYIQQIISKGNQPRVFSTLCQSIYVYIYLSKHYSTRTGRSRSPRDLKGNLMNVQGCDSHVCECQQWWTDGLGQLIGHFISFCLSFPWYIQDLEKCLETLHSFCFREPNTYVHISM